MEAHQAAAIEAQIPYLAAMKDKPLSYSGFPELENLAIDWRSMPVRNARALPGGGPTLQQHGFTAVAHRSAVTRFDLSEAWHDAFKAEIIAVLQAATGASEVVVPAVSYRKVDMPGSFGAAQFCHNDFTAGSAARHIAGLDPATAERRLAGRFAVFNI